GTGLATFAGDGGPAASAAVYLPRNVAVDGAGNIYIADTQNHRVRAILAVPPAFSAAPTTLAFTGSNGGAVTVPQSLTLSGPITGLRFTSKIDTGGTGNWLSVSPGSGVTPRLVEVVADPSKLAPGTYPATITILPPTPCQVRSPSR